MDDLLLDISHLSATIPTDDGPVRAVRDVSFQIRRGRTLGVVGESGCGKSMMGLSLMQLVPKPGYVEGKIVYHDAGDGSSIEIHALEPGGDAMRRIRGRRISMIFQEPMTALNPVMAWTGRPPVPVRYRPCPKSEYRGRSSGWTSTPTNSPAACGSAP